jgi:hypothetical protein
MASADLKGLGDRKAWETWEGLGDLEGLGDFADLGRLGRLVRLLADFADRRLLADSAGFLTSAGFVACRFAGFCRVIRIWICKEFWTSIDCADLGTLMISVDFLLQRYPLYFQAEMRKLSYLLAYIFKKFVGDCVLGSLFLTISALFSC